MTRRHRPRRQRRAPSEVGLVEPAEADLLAVIREAAAWGGWMAYHTHDSRRSEPGFPDLVLVRGGECLAVEVKAAGGRATAAQLEWLAALDAVPGIVAELVQGDAEVSALCGRLMRRSGSA